MTRVRVVSVRLGHALSILCAATLLGCAGGGGGGTSGPTPPVIDPPVEPPSCEDGASYEGTFAAIQEVIFERHQCTQQACHGSSAQGGLNLSPDVAYANIIEVASLSSPLPRVLPGDNDRSLLWLKLAAATRPGTVTVPGSPMPSGLPPLSEDELELMRLWIYAGAPQDGTVEGTQDLIQGCLPPVEPITIKPLDPPAPGEGVQLVMPGWELPASSEHEICFASYYDITSQVPVEYQDPGGTLFRFDATELRQDPQSHHLILNYSTVGVDQIHDPSFGEWTCKGGDRDGAACEPTDTQSCGTGLCSTPFKDGIACIGFGPNTGGRATFQIGGAQQAQSANEYHPGVFAQIPMKGILYWNSHAFNLTEKAHQMNGRLNYYFASDQRYPVVPIFNASRIFSANADPFTEQTICNDQQLPRGARLFNLSSHTHQRGKHFTVALPDGAQIYESFVYNDPLDATFNPPLEFDSPNAEERRLRYCSLYNNGVNEDGTPNIEEVTRYSRLPQSVFVPGVPGRCNPVACVTGRVGAACNGVGDDATCDSSPGAADGSCDACRITGGESTENEMFILIGSYYVEPSVAGTTGVETAAAAQRSQSTEIAVPQVKACSTSHGAGHAGHAGEAGGAETTAHAGHR